MLPPTHTAAVDDVRFEDVISVPGNELSMLGGRHAGEIGALSCSADSCRPIPLQIDERDAAGLWVLDQGPEANTDVPARIFDDNDMLLFMATDAGEGRAPPGSFPPGAHVAEIEVSDPLSAGTSRHVYVFAPTPRAPATEAYVSYDAISDRFTGARVQMGYGEAVPEYISIDLDGGDESNVLDRLKVRATASLFWGWLRFTRTEGDLSTEVTGWRAGAIRVIRHQRQQVRLGWGIRSPTFNSYTYFYRDYAEIPLTLRLRVPPTYFFHDILIEVVLDFRDLRGWRMHLPGFPQVEVGRVDPTLQRWLNQRDDTSFALLGPQVNLAHSFDFTPSLATVRRRFVYRDGDEGDPPESVVGSRPGVGYALDQWERADAGEHGLRAVSYAVPVDIDIDAFLRSRAVPLATRVKVISPAAKHER
jgi:hypothetical protein